MRIRKLQAVTGFIAILSIGGVFILDVLQERTWSPLTITSAQTAYVAIAVFLLVSVMLVGDRILRARRERNLSASPAFLSDPILHRIVGVLREQDSLTINDIASALNLPIPVVGFHIVVLEEQGLIERVGALAPGDPRVVAVFRPRERVERVVAGIANLTW